MEDYHKRIGVINNLKDNLANLNRSIKTSQNHTQELKDKSERYQEKIKIKDS